MSAQKVRKTTGKRRKKTTGTERNGEIWTKEAAQDMIAMILHFSLIQSSTLTVFES
jgi:hypothetical protein